MGINYNLNGKTALVTGGSRGLGKEICRSLLESGAEVIFVASSPTQGLETEKELSAYGKAKFVQCDVCDEDSVDSLILDIDKEFGKLDILALNAGATTTSPCRMAEYSYEEFQRLYSSNVFGNFICMKAVINYMLLKGIKGSIVAISSALTEYCSSGFAPYAGAKNALNNLVKYSAYEYAKDGIRINAILPGSMETPAMVKFREESPDAYQAAVDATPLRRIADPIEVARAVTWLCSDDAAYVTGTKIIVDGGISL